MNETDDKYCQYCDKTFIDKSTCEKHVKKCMKYRFNVFKCLKCNFTTKGLRNIEKHNEQCDKPEPSNINEYVIEDDETQQLSNEDKLSRLLELEKVKSQIYRHIIENNTNIKLSPILQKIDDVRSQLVELNELYHMKLCDDGDSVEKTKRNSYKSVKRIIDIYEEPTLEEQTTKIKEVSMNFENIKKMYKTLADAQPIFHECFESVRTNARLYNKPLEMIKKTRTSIMCSMTYDQYVKLLESHLKTLYDIFIEKGGMNEKKLYSHIYKCMNGLDMRLILKGPYFITPLEIDEIQLFKTCLELSVIYPENYTPFFMDDFLKLFHNYGLVIFTLKENIERYLINCYGFFNVIYLPIKQSSDDDPYSFYILDKVDPKGNRCWRMDCRLENVTKNFMSDVRFYLVQLFRTMYQGIFHDNEYRANYMETNTLTENDCEQLLQNIFVLTNQHKLCNLLRSIIRNQATFRPTDKDKFNLYGDDHLLKKQFQELKIKDNSNDNIEVVKMLFDNISYEDAIKFYKQKIVD